MNIKTYAFLAGYLNKEAGNTKAILGEGARFAGYGLGGAAVGAGLGTGIGALAHPEATPIYAAGGGATGYMLGLLLKAKIDQNKGRIARDKLRSKKDLTEQDARNLAVLEDLNKEATGPASRWIEPNITPPQTDTDIKKGKGFQEGFMNMLRARIKEDKQKPITSAGPVRGEASRLLEEFQNLRSLARKPRTRIK